MAVVLMTEMAEFVEQDIVLEDMGKADDIQVQIDVTFGGAASPVRCIVLYGNAVVCESITDGQSGKSRREFGLRLPAKSLNLCFGRDMDILEAFLLSCHRRDDPVASGLEKEHACGIWHDIRHRDADSLDRMYLYAHAAASGALPERHLPDFGVNECLFCFLRHGLWNDTQR